MKICNPCGGVAVSAEAFGAIMNALAFYADDRSREVDPNNRPGEDFTRIELERGVLARHALRLMNQPLSEGG
jgi:hypothetical protein